MPCKEYANDQMLMLTLLSFVLQVRVETCSKYFVLRLKLSEIHFGK